MHAKIRHTRSGLFLDVLRMTDRTYRFEFCEIAGSVWDSSESAHSFLMKNFSAEQRFFLMVVY